MHALNDTFCGIYLKNKEITGQLHFATYGTTLQKVEAWNRVSDDE